MRISFKGPPEAGKSTQAKRVARYLPHYDHSPRLSSGELVSAEDLLTVVDASRHMGEVTAEILEALWHPEHPEYYAGCQRV